MTDYNDGEWHLWHGGDCPVHPKSVVDIIWHDPKMSTAAQAGFASGLKAFDRYGPYAAWPHVVKFRVVTPYVEPVKPREWWAVGMHMHNSLIEAEDFRTAVAANYPGRGHEDTPIIHVREVLE